MSKTEIPSIRFRGFGDAWEQRKLGDVVKEIIRNDPESEAPIMMITANNGFIEQSERYAFNNAGESLKKYILLKKGELAYNHGASKLRPYGSCFALTTAENARIPFVYHCFSAENQNAEFMSIELNGAEIENQLRKIVSSGARMDGLLNISFDEYTSVSVLLPGTEEQDRIADFFRHLDNLITLHQRKFEKLTNVKKSILEKIFPRNGSSYPEIRFKGFTDPWEQRKLSEITDKVTEKNAGLQYVETFTNSAEFGIISQRDFFDHDIAKLGSLDGYYIVKTEDFVYNPRISTSAPVGPINRNKLGRTGVMSPLYTVFRPHDIDTTYLEYFFKCGYWHSFMNFNGDSGARSDRFSIRDNVFFQMPIPIPDIDEQRKIGELLTCLDNLITLHQRKCALLFSPFQAFISMMFTTSTFSWEQRKLGDIADIVGGGTPSTGNQSYWDGDIDWYAPAEIADQIYANSSQKKITGLGYENSSAKMLPPGTVLFTSRAGIGKTAILTRKGCTNQGFQSIVPHRGELDSYFIFSRTEELKRYGELVGAGSTFVEVSGKQMAVMELMMPPTMREQQTIGGFFQQLDHLITLHQRKPFLMKWRTSDANRNQTNRLVL